LAANLDFKNSPVYNQWAKDGLPGYKKIRVNKKGEAYAPAFMVDFAELTDHITGGDGNRKGLLSFNPDEAQHLLSGYFGGLYTTISQTIDSAYKGILPDEDVKMRDTPFRRFYTPESDLSPIGQGEESMYRKVRKKISGNSDLMKGYDTEVADMESERDGLQAGKSALTNLRKR
jgi:hypothetical protein